MNRPVSIRRRLLALLMIAFLVAWLVALALVFRAAWHEVEEVLDADLARSARVFASLLVHEVEEEREIDRRAELVITELGEKGLRRYPQLAAILSRHEKIEQLMLLARADAHLRQTLPMKPVDLRSVALDVVSSLSQMAVDKDIDLGLEAEKASFLRGDYTSLSILMRNLIDNAIRYTPDGGVVTVRITEEAEGRIRLDVGDSGPGVPIEDRGGLFGRFHRGNEEQARGTTGSGLGLSIVQRVAQLHGGRVELGEGLGGNGLTVSVLFAAG